MGGRVPQSTHTWLGNQPQLILIPLPYMKSIDMSVKMPDKIGSDYNSLRDATLVVLSRGVVDTFADLFPKSLPVYNC